VLIKAISLDKGSPESHREKVGSPTRPLRQIAETKCRT
jgi:hypothetical protein